MAQVNFKDGSTGEDRRLDRLVQFDERSRAYPLTETLGHQLPRSYTWRVDVDHVIDQGREGACVGFALANELQARPAEVDLGTKTQAELFAIRDIYHEAQKIDPWPGGSYPNASPTYPGTSILAGVKIAHRLGYFEEYRWTFTAESLALGLGHHGPAVLGMAWFDTNYEPDEDGFIKPEGRIVGGHAILARAIKVVWLEDRHHDGFGDVDYDKSYITLRNSWGEWGHEGSGDCFVTLRDLDDWIDHRMEACFMVHRTTDPEDD